MIHGDESHGSFAAPLLFAVLTVAVCVIGRVRTYPFLDAWTIAFAGSRVFEKLSRLMAGRCFGRQTDSFVGGSLAAARDDAARFVPLPLFVSLPRLGTAVGLVVRYRRGLFKGRLLPILGLVYGSWRSLVEIVRDVDQAAFLDGPLSLTQVARVLVATFGCAYLIQGLATDRRVSPSFRSWFDHR